MARGLLNRSKRRSILMKAASAVALGLPLALAAPSSAQSTWTGAGADTNFTTPANWASLAVPPSGDDLIFATGGSTATLNVAASVNNLTFQRGADFTVDASGGNVLEVGGTIAANDAFRYTVNAPVKLLNPTITVNTQGVQPLPVSGIPQTNVWLAGVIDGSGGITKTGPGRLRISNTGNTFSGEVNINQGDLVITTSGSGQLGNASAVNLGATSGSASATLWFGNNATNITRPVVVRSGNTGTLTIRMPSSSGTARNINALVTVNKDVTIDVNGIAGSSVNPNEGILALNNGLNVVAGTVTKTGFGQLNIAGPFTLNGNLMNNGQGTININTGINLGNATRNIGSTNYPGAQPVININSGPISATDPAAGLNITGQSDLLIITNQNHTFTGTLDIQTGNIWRATGGSLAAPVNLSHPDSTLDNRTNYTIKGLTGSGVVTSLEDSTTVRNLTINVDAGQTYTFSGTIKNLANVIWGYSYHSVTKAGPGTQVLTGNNSYVHATTIQGGVLAAAQGVGLPSASPLVLAGGVWQHLGPAVMTRSLGTGSGQINWSGGGGFSAQGGTFEIRLNNSTGEVTWNTGGFVPGGSPLIFGSSTASGMVDFQNSINLGGQGSTARTIQVNHSGNFVARISGNITGGGDTGRPLTKTGDGPLELTGPNNTFRGDLNITAGELRLSGAAPNVLNVTGAGTLMLNQGASLTANSVNVGKLAMEGGSLTLRDNGGVSRVAGFAWASKEVPSFTPILWNGDFSSPVIFNTDGWGLDYTSPGHTDRWATYNNNPWRIQNGDFVRSVLTADAWAVQVINNSSSGGDLPRAGQTLTLQMNFSSDANLRVRVYGTNRTGWTGFQDTPTPSEMVIDRTVSGQFQTLTVVSNPFTQDWQRFLVQIRAQGNNQSAVIDNIALGITGPSLPPDRGEGKLDLRNNAMIFDGVPYATVWDNLMAGRNNGTWDGPGIMSSRVAADPTLAIGIMENRKPDGTPYYTNFRGQAVDNTAVLLAVTYGGDANLDGKVDVVDLGILATNWQGTGKNWSTGDFNYSPDGKVDVVDLGILATNWQKGVGSPLGLSFADALASFPEFSGVTVVPEPGTLGLLVLAALGLMARRRRS
jgi:autotransporter-associated beta strand protein